MPPTRCRHCSAEIASADRYCPECGRPIAAPSSRFRLARLLHSAPPVPLLVATGPAMAGQAALQPSVTTSRPRRPRRRYAFWISFALAAVIAVVAGVLTWQIIETMGTINKVSTPPPIVSGSALGGSPEVQIETGPARTAVAAAKSTQTPAATAMPIPTNTTTPTDVPQPTSTLVPTEQPSDTPESGAFPPDDLNPPDASETPDAGTEPTEDPDLPTEIDVPVDNLTPTAPAITSPGEGDDSDLPTEIDVPIDNLTPTPPLVASPGEGDDSRPTD